MLSQQASSWENHMSDWLAVCGGACSTLNEPFVACSGMLCRYIHGLFALAHDAAASVRAEVCKGMVQMLTLRPDKLSPFLYQVCEGRGNQAGACGDFC